MELEDRVAKLEATTQAMIGVIENLAGQLVAARKQAFFAREVAGLATFSLTRLLPRLVRSEEHTSELQSLMRISYAVFCLKKKKLHTQYNTDIIVTPT